MKEWKRGDLVLVWGNRIGRVKQPSGSGSKVFSSGKRVHLKSSEVYPSGRVLVELVDGVDPPAGYSAWWPADELEPIQLEGQLSLFNE